MTQFSNNSRPSWDEYFMMAAKLISVMATCTRLQVGTVIVKNRRIISSGFNGAPPKQPHCTEVGCLIFKEEGASCRRVIHSEHNAILQDSRNVEGSILYSSVFPCIDCMKAIVAAKIIEVVYDVEHEIYRERYKAAKDLAVEAGINLRQIPEVKIVETLSSYYGSQEKSIGNVNSKKIVRNEEVLEF